MCVVRIHVVRASHLLIGFVCALLVIAIIWILADKLLGGEEEAVSVQSADYVCVEAETEAIAASASAVFAPVIETGMRAEVLRAGEYARVEIKPPRVLIYHTHTHEAYARSDDAQYVETSAWRTRDNGHNIVRVGAELAELLAGYGFEVIHDQTDHELTELNTAYTRSLETLDSYAGEIDVYIDMHRDAYNANGSGNPFSINVDGVDTARLMLLVGNGVGFGEMPYYAQNFEIATKLTHALNARSPGLCRPVMVKDGRYNQHISPCALLVEVGHNLNSLDQALAAMPHLASALSQVLSPETALMLKNSP